jgi:hypothetical protein
MIGRLSDPILLLPLDSDELDEPLVVEEELLVDGIDWPLELYDDELGLGSLLLELLDEGIPGFSPCSTHGGAQGTVQQLRGNGGYGG